MRDKFNFTTFNIIYSTPIRLRKVGPPSIIRSRSESSECRLESSRVARSRPEFAFDTKTCIRSARAKWKTKNPNEMKCLITSTLHRTAPVNSDRLRSTLDESGTGIGLTIIGAGSENRGCALEKTSLVTTISTRLVHCRYQRKIYYRYFDSFI